jgi:phosphoglycerate dehydrogenase-like enzyme
MKLVLAEYPESKDRSIEVEKRHLPPDTEISYAVVNEEDMESYYAALEDADAVLTGFAPIDKTAIDRMKHCKIISVQATGWNFVADAYAAEKGIAVCAVGEYCTQEVADHTMALMLGLCRLLPYHMRRINQDLVWEIETLKDMRVQRFGANTLGIVGFGKIGRAVADRAKAFGMKVIAHDPYIPKEAAEERGVELADIDRILEEADIISIHMNLTSENENYFNKEKFDKMKKQPFIINMSRGAMINEDDLAEALDRHIVSGAGLDVLYSESPDLAANKLINRENVIITPHSGFYSDDAIEACERISAENITYYISGEKEKVFKIVNGV